MEILTVICRQLPQVERPEIGSAPTRNLLGGDLFIMDDVPCYP